ncbi:MAG: hypothetical protein RIT45_105, partial [Pseudomonadota bacterium]
VGPFGALLWAQWLGVGVLFFAGMPFQNFRFGLVVLPAVAALFGLGATELGAGAQVGTRGRLARGALVLGALWTLAWTPRMASHHVQARAERRATVAAVAAAARTVADGAFAEPRPPLLVAFELTADLRHREGVEAVELWDLRPGSPTADAALAELQAAASRRPLVLVVDDGDLATQWAGTPIAGALARVERDFDAGPPLRVQGYRVARLEPRAAGGAR